MAGSHQLRQSSHHTILRQEQGSQKDECICKETTCENSQQQNILGTWSSPVVQTSPSSSPSIRHRRHKPSTSLSSHSHLLPISLLSLCAYFHSSTFIIVHAQSTTTTSTSTTAPEPLRPPPFGACISLKIILENWGFIVEFGDPNPSFCQCNFRTLNGKVQPWTFCASRAPTGFDMLYINEPPRPLLAFPELLLPGLGITIGFENLTTLTCINDCIFGENVLLDTARLPPLLQSLDISNNPNITGTWPSPEFFSITRINVTRSNLCCPDQMPAKNIVCNGAIRSCLGGLVIPPGGESTLPTLSLPTDSEPFPPSTSFPSTSNTISSNLANMSSNIGPTNRSTGNAVAVEGNASGPTISTSLLAVIVCIAILVAVILASSFFVIVNRRKGSTPALLSGKEKERQNSPPIPSPEPESASLALKPPVAPGNPSSMFPDLHEDDKGGFLVSTSSSAAAPTLPTVDSPPKPPTPTLPISLVPMPPSFNPRTAPSPPGSYVHSNPYIQIPSWPQYSPHPRQPPPLNAHLAPLKRSAMDPARTGTPVRGGPAHRGRYGGKGGMHGMGGEDGLGMENGRMRDGEGGKRG
ncbi:hypothetical protein BC829DRAFT_137039 [Chytridium lagenaria]|nr:hypothetical protein BC829DRAFT_137039 [Chytridium lagenaria]